MATGLTARLDEDDLTARKWFLETLALNFFGVFYDIGYGRTEEQLSEFLRDESGLSYYADGYERTKARKIETANWTLPEWKAEYDATLEFLVGNYVNSAKRCFSLRTRHDEVYRELEKLYAGTVSQLVKDVAEFGMGQLDLTRSENTPYFPKIPTLVEYIDEQKRSMERDLKYFYDEMVKHRMAKVESQVAYKIMRDEVHRILDTAE